MFERFTEKAKRILFLARYEASQQGMMIYMDVRLSDILPGCAAIR